MRTTVLWGMLAALLVALSGCAAISSGYGQGGQNADGRSYEEARLDNVTSATVTTLLVQDRSVPAMDIEVTTLDGVVTLSGSVPSDSAARRAEALAASVSGVKEVVNNLQIRR